MARFPRIFCVAVLTAVALVGSSLPARGDEKCERKIREAEAKLHEAVERHGENSKQARKRRDQLEDARRRCGDRHEDHHDMDHDHL